MTVGPCSTRRPKTYPWCSAPGHGDPISSITGLPFSQGYSAVDIGERAAENTTLSITLQGTYDLSTLIGLQPTTVVQISSIPDRCTQFIQQYAPPFISASNIPLRAGPQPRIQTQQAPAVIPPAR
jgi:hypothetical protein